MIHHFTSTTTRLLIVGAAGILAAGSAGHATADASYDVINATNGNGTSHAFWLPPGGDSTAPGTYYHWIDGSLTFNGTSWADSTTAVLMGRIQEADNASPNSLVTNGTQFDVEIYFNMGVDYSTWTDDSGLDRDVKIENGADPTDWRFFELDTSRGNKELQFVAGSGTGSSPLPSGTDIDLILRSDPGKTYGFQVGNGASMKHPNTALGASSWIKFANANGAKGDINIEIDLNEDSVVVVPNPTAVFAVLPMLAALGMRRRRRVL